MQWIDVSYNLNIKSVKRKPSHYEADTNVFHTQVCPLSASGLWIGTSQSSLVKRHLSVIQFQNKHSCKVFLNYSRELKSVYFKHHLLWRNIIPMAWMFKKSAETQKHKIP